MSYNYTTFLNSLLNETPGITFLDQLQMADAYIISLVTQKGFFQFPVPEAIEHAQTLNVNNDPTVTTLINNINTIYTNTVGSVVSTGTDYSQINMNMLSIQELNNDVAFNQIVAEFTLESQTSGVDYSSLHIVYYFFVMGLLSKLNIFQQPFYFGFTNDVFNSTTNLACRYHMYDNTSSPIISLVDAQSGVERFRLMNYYDDDDMNDKTKNPCIMRNIKRVVSGVVSSSPANLTIQEMLELGNCIPAYVVGYNPYSFFTYETEQAGQKTLSEYGPVNACAQYTVSNALYQNFIEQSNITPFVDGQNGDIVFGGPRVLALDKPQPDANYLLNWSFLPWNNYAYALYDTTHNTYIQPCPYNFENLYTILKIFGLVWLLKVILSLFFRSSLFNAAETEVLSINIPTIEFY
jgi:hypothetical protein